MGKIITFWSPVNSTGVTTTLILLGQQMSKKYNVCLLDLDLNNPDISLYLNIDDAEHNIDNLFPYIEGDNLTEDIFKLNLVKTNGFNVMQGTRKVDKGPLFKPEDLEPVLKMAKGLFDYVLVNINSAIDNAGSYLALKESDMIFKVLNQNMLHFKKYIDKMQLVDPFLKSSIICINKYNKHISLDLDSIGNSLGEKVYPLTQVKEQFVINNVNNQHSFIEIFTGRKAKKYQKDLGIIKTEIMKKITFQEKQKNTEGGNDNANI